MKSTLFLTTIVFFLISCISMNATSLVKGKTSLRQVQNLYSNNSKGESLVFFKEFTQETTNRKFNVYIATEKSSENVQNDIASQVLNTAIRYLVFDENDVYVDTVQNPFNIQKNINKL